MFSNYSRVRLMTTDFEAQGAKPFDVGYIIEVYADGDYEVEFSDAYGTTTAQIVVREGDIQLDDAAPDIINRALKFGGSEAPTRAEEPTRTTKERLP